ncbi:hypothetical protein V5799_009351 [Amblyomma americanum]|uniref:Uncharacterized protein n=1 Tax=Amblyomma americanum TaxID=6943 RepID=A0AAQ4FC91_AMBAM
MVNGRESASWTRAVNNDASPVPSLAPLPSKNEENIVRVDAAVDTASAGRRPKCGWRVANRVVNHREAHRGPAPWTTPHL